jgi:hypothetical protein
MVSHRTRGPTNNSQNRRALRNIRWIAGESEGEGSQRIGRRPGGEGRMTSRSSEPGWCAESWQSPARRGAR